MNDSKSFSLQPMRIPHWHWASVLLLPLLLKLSCGTAFYFCLAIVCITLGFCAEMISHGIEKLKSNEREFPFEVRDACILALCELFHC